MINSFDSTKTAVLAAAMVTTTIALGLSVASAASGDPLVPDQLMMGVWSCVSITWCWRIRLSASATSTVSVLAALRPILEKIEDDQEVDDLLAELNTYEGSHNVVQLKSRRRPRRRPRRDRDSS